jgi:uncharacterized membrane protein
MLHLNRKLSRWMAGVSRLTFFASMVAGVGLMFAASQSYWELGREHPFFLEKLPLAQPELWLTALYVHVPSALFALPACLLLLVQRLRVRWPRVHRWLGRVTGALVLLAVVPSGAYLALFAQGGLWSTLGFWTTGAIAFVAMLKSIQSARRGDLRTHRRCSAHVAAQLCVAVISRFSLVGAEALGLYSEWVYIAALWLPVFGCALAAELLTASGPLSFAKGSPREKLVGMSRLDPVR